jgi:hypothetical protein
MRYRHADIAYRCTDIRYRHHLSLYQGLISLYLFFYNASDVGFGLSIICKILDWGALVIGGERIAWSASEQMIQLSMLLAVCINYTQWYATSRNPLRRFFNRPYNCFAHAITGIGYTTNIRYTMIFSYNKRD